MQVEGRLESVMSSCVLWLQFLSSVLLFIHGCPRCLPYPRATYVHRNWSQRLCLGDAFQAARLALRAEADSKALGRTPDGCSSTEGGVGGTWCPLHSCFRTLVGCPKSISKE